MSLHPISLSPHALHSNYNQTHVNDPSAGSPTETLLRLVLPLNGQIRVGSQAIARSLPDPH